MALTNAQRAKRYRLKKKKAREVQKGAQEKAVLQPHYRSHNVKAFWERTEQEYQILLKWNLWEFNEALEGVASAKEIHEMAALVTCDGWLVEFKTLEERQAFRNLHVSLEKQKAQRLAEHEVEMAEQRAREKHIGPTYVDDKKLAGILNMPDHPDHPSRRQQIGYWDAGLPDDDEDEDEDDES